MKSVKRTQKPDSLNKNAAQWTQELLSQIKEKGSYAKVDDKYKNRYHQDDVKTALEKMYSNHCCYCESIIGISTYGRIEHLRPKSLPQFYKYTYEWDNLHWCCEICNSSYKKAKWNFENPILDPSKDDIKLFLRLNLQTGEYEKINDNPRAKTTIEDTGLNRENLVKARHRIIVRFIKDFRAHRQCGDEELFLTEWKELADDMSFPSLYEELIAYINSKTTF